MLHVTSMTLKMIMQSGLCQRKYVLSGPVYIRIENPNKESRPLVILGRQVGGPKQRFHKRRPTSDGTQETGNAYCTPIYLPKATVFICVEYHQ